MTPGDITKSMYLASPYSSDSARVVNQRHRDVCKAAGGMINLGKVVFSPIAHSHDIARICGIQGDFATWAKQDAYWIRKLDEFGVLMLPGWDESVGVKAEIQLAVEFNKPVFYIDPEPWL